MKQLLITLTVVFLDRSTGPSPSIQRTVEKNDWLAAAVPHRSSQPARSGQFTESTGYGRSILDAIPDWEADARPGRFCRARKTGPLARWRPGGLGYPARAIRTSQFLYIQNLKPDRWPAGDPEEVMAVGIYGDIDNGSAKTYLINHRDQYQSLADQALSKRPAEELYDLTKDPHQQTNVAKQPSYQTTLSKLRQRLLVWRQRTQDLRLTTKGDAIDAYPYYGNKAAKEPK